MNRRATVTTSRPCPISNSNAAWVVSDHDRHGKKLRNVLSTNSGLIFVDPVPFENTEEFYKSEYRKSYKGVHQPKPKHIYRAGRLALKRISRIEPLIDKLSACLDAGSSSGEFVYLMRKNGYEIQGVEANEPYAEFSMKSLDVPVSITPFSKFKPEREFDLITMFHVLEHLENPVRDLRHLAESLRIGGKMVIEVPNILYPNMAFSNKWHPGHLFSYTKESLSSLMKIVGLEVIRCDDVDDGANLWGEFRKVQEMNPSPPEQSLQPEEVFETIHKDKFSYYFRFQNYLKFIPKSIRQLKEKIHSMGKNPTEILDQLHESVA
jgi:2-polyprenyl-3-methyl-5-hydroxy-6-metoxy-1,4-benzoquinol methylase